MSTLFSSARAITSCADKYRLPARISDSRRGVLPSVAVDTTRRCRLNGRSRVPATRGPGGVSIVISGVWAQQPVAARRVNTEIFRMKRMVNQIVARMLEGAIAIPGQRLMGRGLRARRYAPGVRFRYGLFDFAKVREP